MAQASAWAQALLIQAEEEIQALALLVTNKTAPATTLHLFQMVFEKLGKAYWLRSAQRSESIYKILSEHKIVDKFLSAIQIILDWKAVGFSGQKIFADTFNLVRRIESRLPRGVKENPQPQLEYPWEDPASDTVKTPVGDLPEVESLFGPDSPNAVDLLKLAEYLHANFDNLFP